MSFLIPSNPNEIVIEDFARKQNFIFRNEGYNFRMWDKNNKDVYIFPLVYMSPIQILEIMRLIVSLRNMKESWLKEKDYHKRRKILSRMNSIKGELNRWKIKR